MQTSCNGTSNFEAGTVELLWGRKSVAFLGFLAAEYCGEA
jgi:hypothetical protein